MERYDCECHNHVCQEIEGARLKFDKDVYGSLPHMEAMPTPIENCEVKKELGKKVVGLTIRLEK